MNHRKILITTMIFSGIEALKNMLCLLIFSYYRLTGQCSLLIYNGFLLVLHC